MLVGYEDSLIVFYRKFLLLSQVLLYLDLCVICFYREEKHFRPSGDGKNRKILAIEEKENRFHRFYHITTRAFVAFMGRKEKLPILGIFYAMQDYARYSDNLNNNLLSSTTSNVKLYRHLRYTQYKYCYPLCTFFEMKAILPMITNSFLYYLTCVIYLYMFCTTWMGTRKLEHASYPDLQKSYAKVRRKTTETLIKKGYVGEQHRETCEAYTKKRMGKP